MLTLVPLQDSDCAATETPWYAATSWLYLQFLPRMEVDDTWPENILWTDETHFTLGGAVNTENCRIWGSTKPLVLHQRPLHSATVWCGFTSTFILGRVFFERIAPRGRVRCTVTSASYENILMQTVIPALQEGNCVETTPLSGTTACQLPSSTSASWNLRWWKHYLQKFSKSSACKISWPQSMWPVAVGLLEGLCLPRTCSICGWSEDEHTAICYTDSTRIAASNNWSCHFTDAACSQNLWCTHWKHFVTSW